MNNQEMSAGVELSATESWALLRQAAVGRLAVIIDGRPDIFPVNHVVDHGSLVFRTAAGSKLAGAVGNQVAYEVDGYDLETASAWSVVVKGHAHEVNRLYDVLEAVGLPLFPWHTTLKPHFVRIEPDKLTGRRFKLTRRARSTLLPDPELHHPHGTSHM